MYFIVIELNLVKFMFGLEKFKTYLFIFGSIPNITRVEILF